MLAVVESTVDLAVLCLRGCSWDCDASNVLPSTLLPTPLRPSPQLHFDTVTGTFADFGNHTEKVGRPRPLNASQNVPPLTQ